MITIYPNQQDAVYDAAAMPPGCSNLLLPISGGYLKWPKRWPIEEVLAVRQGEIRQALGNHFPNPQQYAGMKVLLDLEGGPNPGSQRAASAELEERIADAADLRIIEASRHFPNSCEVYLWCARNAIQHDANPDDFGDTAALVHMAKRGMLIGAAGVAMGVFPTCTSAENPNKFGKVASAIETALVMGEAIVRAAALVDGVERRVMVQGSMEAWGPGGRRALPAEDVASMVGWAWRAGVEHYGLWSGKATLAGGASALDVLGRSVALAKAGVDQQVRAVSDQDGAAAGE